MSKNDGSDTPRTITPEERERRKKAVDYARGSVRLEGLILDDHAEHVFSQYVDGSIDMKEVDEVVANLIFPS